MTTYFDHGMGFNDPIITDLVAHCEDGEGCYDGHGEVPEDEALERLAAQELANVAKEES